uniref:Piezo-type mechanosensitive ion channel component 2-like n=1 Tax=Saccoglossus kowalevskii TaxID=10224 RepID=A0ABM0ME29_SACKO|nr:PREDICTED: piezo-type mechanosensitive ion channel component 2-like [Saccoglossus kowalevskii]
MATSIACRLLFVVLLPCSLLAAAIFRYNAFSFIYFTCFLVLPLLPSPSRESMQGHTGRFLKTLLILTSIILGAQLVFQIVLLVLQPYGHWLEFCSTLETALRQVGLQRLDIPVLDAVRAIAPDVLMFTVSLIVYIACYKLTRNTPRPTSSSNTTVHRKTSQMSFAMDLLWSFTTCFLTALAGIILPSVTSSVYFLTFLVVVSWWSCYKHWGRKLVYVRIVMLTYCGAHLVALYLYQFQFFQQALPAKSLYSRLFGLTAIIIYDCDCPYKLLLDTTLKWPAYVNPVILLVYYWYLALLTCQWIQNPYMLEVTHKRHKKRRTHSAGERELLVDTSSQSQRTKYQSIDPAVGSFSEPQLESVAESQSGAASSKIPTTPLSDTEEKPRVRKPWMSILFFVMKQSYTVLLIVMMAWSITYHSWLTFVLLLWACFIWMIPNSRAACLHSSPFLVIYAEVLLIISYVYGLYLNENELPTKGAIDYEDIGLVHHEHPCVHLAVKILYTSVFWLTLRQYMRERLLKKKNLNSLEIGLQPFGLIFSTEQSIPSGLNSDVDSARDFHDGEDSATMKKFGLTIHGFLTKYWIVLCGAMFLIVSLQQDVVVYKIIYMLLFLIHMIILVISYRVWRFIMLTYWWIIVFYSMCVLVIIYTYQFDNFPQYWINGTGMTEDLLSDIGLQQYDTQTLFVRLLTPTVFVIIIVIQLHYYHQPFLVISAVSQIRYRRARAKEEPADVIEEDSDHPNNGKDGLGKHGGSTDTLDHKSPTEYMKQFWDFLMHWYRIVTAIIWRLLEIHMVKVIFFSVTVVAVTQVSAMNFLFIFFMFFAIPIPWLQGAFTVCCMIWASVILLTKMIYQLKLIDDHIFNTTCFNNVSTGPFPTDNVTYSLSKWIGFEKTDNIFVYTIGYIIIILVIVFETVVKLHQKQYRWENNLDTPKRGILFDDINRHNADTSLTNMAKYLINYFFYKFGLEICYIMTVVAISVRLDVYSVIYATWLGILMLLLRRITYLVWPVYMCFLALLFPILYFMCLGLPGALCIGYPWYGKLDSNLMKWLYLPSYVDPPKSTKLIADFFQLLFVCLQWQVFRVEKKIGDQYGGGDNEMVDREYPVEDNPVPNFMNNKTFLDLIKNGLFNYTLWVTLAMVFLAGTSLVSIFCLGYLGLCFFFMWYGQDYLLKPRPTLLKAWNVIMMYNVAVIFVKACLQVVACVYIERFYSNLCWLIQLLSLVCLHEGYKPDVYDSPDCEVPVDQAGMSWDGVLFAFLLLQKRIFTCHYFQYIVEEVKEQNTMAARGAVLINQQLAYEVKTRKSQEEATLRKIRRKIERVKKKQAKLRGKDGMEFTEHFAAIRGGDKYLWEDESDEDMSDYDSSEDEDGDSKTPKKAGPIELAYSAITEGTKKTIKKERAIKRSLSQVDESDGKMRRRTVAGLPTTEDEEEGDTTDGAGPSKSEMKEALLEEEDEEEENDETEQPKEQHTDTLWDKFCNTITVGLMIFLRSLDAVITFFNRASANYRYVAYKLKVYRAELRKADMQKDEDRISIRLEDETRPRDDDRISTSSQRDKDIDERSQMSDDSSLRRTGAIVKTKEPQTKFIPPIPPPHSADDFEYMDDINEDGEVARRQKLSRPVRLLFSVLYAIIAQSQIVCYFLMILSQIVEASLLSLPYPISVFLWATLTVPRPTKRYWICAISYTEIVVLVKFFFQFGFWPWNSEPERIEHMDDPFWWPRVIGIDKRDSYAAYDLAILLALFFHRSVLKSHGLWKDGGDMVGTDDAISRGSESTSKAGELEDVASPGLTSISTDLTVIDDGTSRISGEDDEDGDTTTSTDEDTESWLGHLFKPFIEFYQQMVDPTYSAVADIYVIMFLCDLICFLITVFAFWAFGKSMAQGNVTVFIEENKLPLATVMLWLVQFALIIIDRGLYLRKNVVGKFIFLIIQVVVVHIWLFFLLPHLTKTLFIDNTPAQLWYFVKCCYFGLSAYQIRSGYPTRILGNFLTKKYNYVNLFLFKGFCLIPFLLELRIIMDWTWTDTTLALSHWMKIEDIYNIVYELKCWRKGEKDYPTPRGQKKGTLSKYFVGLLLLILLILIIWFPLIYFSVIIESTSVSNPPSDCTIHIQIDGYEYLYQMSAQQEDLKPILSNKEYDHEFKEKYKENLNIQAFLQQYEREDIYVSHLSGSSTTVWTISPPSRDLLIQDLVSTRDLDIKFFMSFTRRPTNALVVETVSYTAHHTLNPNKIQTKLIRMELAAMLNKTRSDPVNIPNMFPRYVVVPASGEVRPAELLLPGGEKNFSNVDVQLQHDEDQKFVEWWRLQEYVDKDSPRYKYLTIISFNDRVTTDALSFLTSYGIIGLYVSLVLVVGRFVRMFVSGISYRIMFEELPNPDRILRLCLDIFMVRESNEFLLEEELTAKLIYLYRSPETLIQVTKEKQQ